MMITTDIQNRDLEKRFISALYFEFGDEIESGEISSSEEYWMIRIENFIADFLSDNELNDFFVYVHINNHVFGNGRD